MEKDNAHILLAETLIYSIPQPSKSSEIINHSYPAPECDIKVTSAEHMVLTLLSTFENPHELKASEALELLKNRGDPLAQMHSSNGDVADSIQQAKTSCIWNPPENKLILQMRPRPK